MKNIKSKNGFATIPTILALSAIILVIAAGITASTFTETMTAKVEEESSAALRYSEAGARDALMRIARNKKYSCASADCYSVEMVSGGCTSNAGCAKVSVSTGRGTSGDPKIIVSKGIVQEKTRKMEVRVVFDSNGHGEIASAVWKELTD